MDNQKILDDAADQLAEASEEQVRHAPPVLGRYDYGLHHYLASDGKTPAESDVKYAEPALFISGQVPYVRADVVIERIEQLEEQLAKISAPASPPAPLPKQKFVVTVESTAAVVIDLEVEAEDEDEASAIVGTMLEGMLGPRLELLVDELMSPDESAVSGYAGRSEIGAPVRRAAIELDESGFEIVEVEPPQA